MRSTLILSAALGLLIAAPASAKSWVDTDTANRVSTQVTLDDTLVMRTDQSFAEVRVANADIADVVVLTDRSFHVMGKGSGKTNVMLYDKASRLIDIIDVRVGFDVAGLEASLTETFPRENISVRPMANGLYLSGNVSTLSVAERAAQIAQAYAPDRVTNGLSVRDSHQVMLEVRFVEASRDVVKDLGIGLLTEQAGEFTTRTGVGLLSGGIPALSALVDASGGNTTLDVTLDALETSGTIRTLAEPNLVAMSGEKASFLAGGEFPIPVSAQFDQITIEFRQFGVGLAFTPTVLDDGIISLKVAPEVSQLDPANGVRVGGVDVPALRVRRANTTVELRNAQSFAIAGLLQNDDTTTKSQVPWLGDIPVLGALFKSSRYQQAQTELVIIVTPRLVRPAPDISDLRTPLDGTRPPTDAELFVGGLEGFDVASDNADVFQTGALN